MDQWIWQHIIGPAINGVFAGVPLVVWIVIGCLLLGLAFKTFGWQGVVAAAVGLLAFGAYRQGWKARDSIDSEHIQPNTPDLWPSPGPPAKPKRKPTPPSMGDTWFDKVKRGEKV